MGNQCCGPDPAMIQQFPTTEPIQLTKVTQPQPNVGSTQNNVHCSLCSTDKKQSLFLHHLDTCHFAKLIPHSNQPLKNSVDRIDNIKQIICILCSHSSNTFFQHQKHIDAYHEYIKKNIDKNIYIQKQGFKLQSNQNIKDRILPISKLDFYIDSTGRNAQIGGDQFDIQYHSMHYKQQETLKNNNQQKPSQNNSNHVYNPEQAKSDLVWRYIFDGLEQASFYNLHAVEKHGKILVQSKIFIKKQVSL